MLKFAASNDVVLAGEEFGPGEHEVAKPSKELVKHAGSAHAAGAIVVSEGLDVSHVQSQADGEKAYAAAQGEWVPGEFVAAVIELDAKGEPVLVDGEKVVLEPAYTSAGRWSGGWSEGNVLQHRLDAAQGDPDALAAVEADIAALKEAK